MTKRREKPPPIPRPKGLYGNLHHCKRIDRLMDAEKHRATFEKFVADSGLTIVQTFLKDYDVLPDYADIFDVGGYTFGCVLEESHCIIHTVPEKGYADVDVYVCNINRDNEQKARVLYDFLAKYFDAKKSELAVLPRGFHPDDHPDVVKQLRKQREKETRSSGGIVRVSARKAPRRRSADGKTSRKRSAGTPKE